MPRDPAPEPYRPLNACYSAWGLPRCGCGAPHVRATRAHRSAPAAALPRGEDTPTLINTDRAEGGTPFGVWARFCSVAGSFGSQLGVIPGHCRVRFPRHFWCSLRVVVACLLLACGLLARRASSTRIGEASALRAHRVHATIENPHAVPGRRDLPRLAHLCLGIATPNRKKMPNMASSYLTWRHLVPGWVACPQCARNAVQKPPPPPLSSS